MARDTIAPEPTPESQAAYEPPRVEESADFETLALACTSQAGDVINCGPGPYSGSS